MTDEQFTELLHELRCIAASINHLTNTISARKTEIQDSVEEVQTAIIDAQENICQTIRICK